MPDQDITLKDTVEAYLKHLNDTGAKESTIRIYRRSLNLALTYFGEDRKTSDILAVHIGKFFTSDAVCKHENGEPKAEPTVKQNKRVFRQCLSFAKEQGLIQILQVPKSELQHARTKAPDKLEETENHQN